MKRESRFKLLAAALTLLFVREHDSGDFLERQRQVEDVSEPPASGHVYVVSPDHTHDESEINDQFARSAPIEIGQPTVSAIVPTFNEGELLSRVLPDALLRAQSSGLTGIIVIDDASADDSSSRLSAMSDKNLTVILGSTNSGWSAAAKKGMQRSGDQLLALCGIELLPHLTTLRPAIACFSAGAVNVVLLSRYKDPATRTPFISRLMGWVTWFVTGLRIDPRSPLIIFRSGYVKRELLKNPAVSVDMLVLGTAKRNPLSVVELSAQACTDSTNFPA